MHHQDNKCREILSYTPTFILLPLQTIQNVNYNHFWNHTHQIFQNWIFLNLPETLVELCHDKSTTLSSLCVCLCLTLTFYWLQFSLFLHIQPIFFLFLKYIQSIFIHLPSFHKNFDFNYLVLFVSIPLHRSFSNHW